MTYDDLLKGGSAKLAELLGELPFQRHRLLNRSTRASGRSCRRWIYHIPGASRLESVPVVVDGVMYMSQPNEVYALDGRSGRLIWEYHHQPAIRKGRTGASPCSATKCTWALRMPTWSRWMPVR